jgi:predicted dehydrogenase
MQKIRFGVLSTAHIGVQKVIPAMQKGEYTEVVAIASRSLDKARDMARHLGIPRWYGSYMEVIEALVASGCKRRLGTAGRRLMLISHITSEVKQ